MNANLNKYTMKKNLLLACIPGACSFTFLLSLNNGPGVMHLRRESVEEDGFQHISRLCSQTSLNQFSSTPQENRVDHCCACRPKHFFQSCHSSLAQKNSIEKSPKLLIRNVSWLTKSPDGRESDNDSAIF